ncbi:MAG: 5-oxoprolinase subunit PxpA [Akkermansiaceae bacterium]|nr:5-oxoprolinase subunit PxpA [Akkermansiaceae bacterium]
MKLNADVGEGMGNDEALFRWIDMANIACGYHAGDTGLMARTVDLAVTYGVAVGAHPGYRDREGFGRRSVAHLPGEIERLVLDQVEALDAVCREQGTQVQYVKPHGALYHDMMQRMDVLEEILQALCKLAGKIPLMVMARTQDAAEKLLALKFGVPLLFEAFADRAYTDDGTLVDRSLEGAVFTTPGPMIAQARQIASQGSVTTASGKVLPLRADSICVHGDNEASIAAAKQIYLSLRT